MAIAGLTLNMIGCAPRLQSPGPVVSAPSLAEDHFVTHDGYRLAMRVWPAGGQTTSVIVAVHGFNDYSKAFEEPAAWWAGHGITTYAYDQRGFGETLERGIWAGGDTLVADLVSVVSAIKERHPGKPVFLLGESMGGAVVMAALADRPAKSADVEGAILSAPAVWGWSSMNPFYKTTLWLSAHVMPWKGLTGQSLDITPSDNFDMLVALGKDPLIIKKTRIDAIYGLTGLMERAYRSASAIELPLLVLYGEKDEIIPKKPVDKVISQLNGGARVIRYENGYHMLLRDLQARRVWRDILEWIESR